MEQATWEIDQQLSRRGDTFKCSLWDEHATSALTFVPKALQTITLKDLSLNTTLFAGVITQPKYLHHGPNLAEWQLDCLDWTYYADTTIVTGDYFNQAADAVVKTLVTQRNIGLTTNHVQSGPQLPRIKINHLTLSEAITRVSQYASQGSDYSWYIDENLDVHFFNPSQITPTGSYFTDNLSDNSANAIHYKADSSFDYLWDGTTVRTRATVRGADIVPSTAQVDSFVGNASSSAWPLTYPPSSSPSFSLTVGGTSKTVQTDQGGTPTTQYIVTQMPSGQWFLRTGTDPTPGSGTVLQLTYFYALPVQTQVDDFGLESAYGGPNGGVFEVYIADSEIRDVGTAKARGQREVQEYAPIQERVELETSEDFTGHIRAGTILGFTNVIVPNSVNGYAPGFSDVNFLIIQNKITGIPGNHRAYAVTGVRVG